MPSATTLRSARSTRAADSSDTTRRAAGPATGVATPEASMVEETRRGGTYMPRLAITLYAAQSWSTVLDWNVPMDAAARSGSVHEDASGSTPAPSAGCPTPVGWPNPKSLSVRCRRSAPTRRPIWIVPTFDESAMISSTVIVSVAC